MNAVMETKATRAEHKEQFRKTVLNAAREMFVQDGYEGFSMRKLASKIGCSAGGLYLYFKNKEELFQTLVDESFRRLTSLLTGLCNRSEGRDPIELLKKGLYTYVEFGLRNANDYRFAFLQARGNDSTNIPPPVEVLGMMVVRCQEQGRLVDTDSKLITQSLWTSVHGVTSLFIQRPGYPWADKGQVVEHVVANLVAGFLTVPSPRELPETVQAAVA